MTDRLPNSPGKYSAVVTGGELQKMQTGKPFAITLQLDDDPVREGTPYSKAAVLPDELAAKLCPEAEDPAPKDAFRGLWEKKADSIRRKTGAVILTNDAANTPLKGLKLFGKTTQNGTPTPESPVELVNIGVKNYLPKTEYTAEGTGGSYDFIKKSDPFPTLPAGDYILSFNASTASLPPAYINFYDATGTSILYESFIPTLSTTLPITLPSEATSMSLSAKSSFTITNATLTRNGEGSICITVAGNNLFNKENAETVGGYIDPNGNILGTASIGTTWFVPVSENTKYTISTNSPGGFYFRAIRFLDAVKSLIGFDGKDTNTYGTVFTGGKTTNFFATATFTTPKGCKYVQVGSLKEHWGSDSTIMLNYGDTVLPYEPYKEIQTLTASTPNGLPGIPVTSGGNYTDENGQAWICDEIDFARGVYVQRIGRIGSYADESTATPYISSTGSLSTGATVLYALDDFAETALSAEELEAYALLHTNTPNTTILNDAGAGMEIAYYTPTTPVQMAYSPADAGKVLSIDEHGFVALTQQKDRIVEQGISGNWTYRKWESGVAECWMKYTATADNSSAFGDSPVWDKFYLCHTADIPLPVVFTQMPTFCVSVSGGAPVIYSGTIYVSNSTTNIIKLTSYVRTEDTSKSYSITYCVHAIGRWK